MCEQLWMLAVLLWAAPGTVAARHHYQSCAAALSCSLIASHPKALVSLQDPHCRLGFDFVPQEMKELQHSPAWYPAGDGSCKRQLSRVLGCALSAFDFDNEFMHVNPAKLLADCVLLLLRGDDIAMMQRALNAMQVIAFDSGFMDLFIRTCVCDAYSL
jgi:hypothetical protein